MHCVCTDFTANESSSNKHIFHGDVSYAVFTSLSSSLK